MLSAESSAPLIALKGAQIARLKRDNNIASFYLGRDTEYIELSVECGAD